MAPPSLRRMCAGLLVLSMLPLPGQSREPERQDFASNLRRQVHLEGEGVQRYSIGERMRHYGVPAVSVAVVEGCEVVDARAFGAARPDGTAAGRDTIFMAGSVSKVVAAMGALSLVEDGVLSLDEDVTRHLGSWTLPRPDNVGQGAVTLRHLLSHSAGLTVAGFKGYPHGVVLPGPTDILDGKAPANTPAVRIEAEPGSAWRYSGGGFVLLQHVMEQATAKTFAEVIRRRVLDPAGMSNSAYGSPAQSGHGSDAAMGTLANGEPIPDGWRLYPEHAAAGLWSTPTDLSRLAIGLVRSLRGERHAVLGADTAKEMLRQQAGSWGLGVELSPKGEPPKVSHTGAPVGYRTLWLVFPETCQGATIMTNADEGMTLAYEVARALADQYRWPDPMSSERALSIPLTDEIARRFVGTYQLRDFPAEHFEIELAADRTLTWSRQGRGRRTLAAASAGMLVSPDSGMRLVSLDSTSSGPVSTLELRFGGGVNVAQRLAHEASPGVP